MVKMLMVITSTADEFMKHLNTHLLRTWITCLQSVCSSVFSKLSHIFLHPPQRDFARREELQQSDVEGWLGFITFLCEVFGTMRSSSGEPFRVLVCPIYTCLREVRIHICTLFVNTFVNKQSISPLTLWRGKASSSVCVSCLFRSMCGAGQFPVFGQT